jgi:hypothetical protein
MTALSETELPMQLGPGLPDGPHQVAMVGHITIHTDPQHVGPTRVHLRLRASTAVYTHD